MAATTSLQGASDALTLDCVDSDVDSLKNDTDSDNKWVINTLGGLDNILEFYLKSRSNKVGEEQLESLRGVLSLEELDGVSDLHFELEAENFRKHKAALRVNASHNFYFKILNPVAASFVYYNVILNKYYAIGLQSSYLFFVILSRVSYHLVWIELWHISAWTCLALSLLFSVSLLLSINIDIAKLVLKTFDFWFCMYNYVIFLIAGEMSIVHHSSLSIFLIIFLRFVTFLELVSVFLIDTYFLSFGVRAYITITKLIVWTYWVIWRYFFSPNDYFVWNPTNTKHTYIDWKFVWITSITNIMVFIAKPVITYAVRNLLIMIKYKTCKPKHFNSNSTQKKRKFQSSFTIRLQRPYLQWQTSTNTATTATASNAVHVHELCQRLEKLKLDQETKDKYYQTLNNKQDDIINCLGGMEMIIETYLAYEDANENIKDLISNYMAAAVVIDNIPSANQNSGKTVIKNNGNQSKRGRGPVVLTVSNFNKHETSLNIDASKNLYFKILRPKTASFIYYNVIFSKNKKVNYTISMLMLYFSLTVIATFLKHVDMSGDGGVYLTHDLFAFASLFVGAMFAISYLLGSNSDIRKLIRESFDFWFQMYNLVIFSVSNFVILYDLGSGRYSLGYVIISCIITTLTMIAVFFVDSYYLSFKTRIFVCVCFTSIWFYWVVDTYFFVSDTKFRFNPLVGYQMEYTAINLKSMYITSLTNMILFTLKGIIGYFITKHGCSCCTTTTTATTATAATAVSTLAMRGTDKTLNLNPSFTILHRRPYLKWNIVKKDQYRASIANIIDSGASNRDQTSDSSKHIGSVSGSPSPRSVASVDITFA